MRHWERNGAVFLWKMGTNRNIQRERWRGRLVHDSVTSSGGLQGVNKLSMPAYANIPSLHQSMLVHKGCKSICSWDRGGKYNIQAVNHLNLATRQLSITQLLHCFIDVLASNMTLLPSALEERTNLRSKKWCNSPKPFDVYRIVFSCAIDLLGEASMFSTNLACRSQSR